MIEEKTSSKRSLVILSLVCVAVVLVGLIASSKLGLGNGAFFAGVALIVSAIGVIGYLKIFPRTQTLQQPKITPFQQIREIEQESVQAQPSRVEMQILELTNQFNKKFDEFSSQLKQVQQANIKPVPLEEQILTRQKESELEKANNELKRQQVISSGLEQIKTGVENQTIKAKLKDGMLSKKEPSEITSIMILEVPLVSTVPVVPEQEKKEKQALKTEEEPVEEKLFQ